MANDRRPELAARLRGLGDAVDEAEARVGEAQRAMEELLEMVRAARGELSQSAPAPAPAPPPEQPPPASPSPPEASPEPRRNDPYALDAARLVAIEMADAGATREDVEVHLRASYSLTDTGALLDDVFGDGPGSRRASSV